MCGSPVLPLLGLGLLVASRHLGFVARLSGGADFDGRVLKRGGRDGHFSSALRDDRNRISQVFFSFFSFGSLRYQSVWIFSFKPVKKRKLKTNMKIM